MAYYNSYDQTTYNQTTYNQTAYNQNNQTAYNPNNQTAYNQTAYNHSRLYRHYSTRLNSGAEYGSRQQQPQQQQMMYGGQEQQQQQYQQPPPPQQQQQPYQQPPSADDYYAFEQRTRRNIVDAETRLYTKGGRNLEPVKSDRNPFARSSPRSNSNDDGSRRGSSPAHLEYQRSKNLISARRNHLGAPAAGGSASASREVSRNAPPTQGRYPDQEYTELSQQITQDTGGPYDALDAPLPPPKRGNAQAHSRGRVSGVSAVSSSVQRKFIWEPWTENQTMPEEFANMTEEEYMEYARGRPEYGPSPSQLDDGNPQQQLQPQETSLDAFQQAFAPTRPESPMRGDTPRRQQDRRQQQPQKQHQDPSRVPTSASELWRAAAEQEYEEELEYRRTGQTPAQRQAMAATNRGDVLSRFSAWRTQTTQLPASPNPTQQAEEQEMASKDPAVPPEGVSMLSYERQAIKRQADERRRRDAELQREVEEQMQMRSAPSSGRGGGQQGGQQAVASPEASGGNGDFLSKFGAWRQKTEEFQKQQQSVASHDPQSLDDDDNAVANVDKRHQPNQPSWAKRNSDSNASGGGSGGGLKPAPPPGRKPTFAKQSQGRQSLAKQSLAAKQSPVSDSGLSTKPGKVAAGAGGGGDFMSKFSAWRTQGATPAPKSMQVLSNPQQNDDGVPEEPQQETRAPMFSIALPGMLASKIVRNNRKAFEAGKLATLDDADTNPDGTENSRMSKGNKPYAPKPPSVPKPPRGKPPGDESSGQKFEYVLPDRTEPEDDDRDENYDNHNFASVPTGLIPDDRNEFERSASPAMSYAPGSDWRYEDPASDGDFMSVYRFSDPRLGRSWTMDSFPRLSEAAFNIVSQQKRIELEGRDRERMLERQREQEREYERQQRAEEARLRELLATAKKEDEVLRREREEREQREREQREREPQELQQEQEQEQDERNYAEEKPQMVTAAKPQMVAAAKKTGAQARVLTREATALSEISDQTPVVELGARSAEDLLRGLLEEIERAGLTGIAGLQEEITAVRSFLDAMAEASAAS